MANRDDQNLLRSGSVIDAIRKSRNCSDPNLGAFDAYSERMLGNESNPTEHLLDQRAPEARVLRLIEPRGYQQLLLRLREKANTRHVS